MDQFEHTYTVGMDEAAVEERLRTAETGVLSLAHGGEAYGIPVAYHWDGEAIIFRLGEHPDSEKVAFIDATERASFLVYHYAPSDESWSVLASGPIERLPPEEADLLEAQDDFLPLRIFGEAMEELEPALYALEVESLTGRTT